MTGVQMQHRELHGASNAWIQGQHQDLAVSAAAQGARKHIEVRVKRCEIERIEVQAACADGQIDRLSQRHGGPVRLCGQRCGVDRAGHQPCQQQQFAHHG